MTTPSPPLGLYVHLPFCKTRCGYCDFAVVTDRDDSQSLYVDCLLREISHWAQESPLEFQTLYFGGGTPSRLAPSEWEGLVGSLRDHFRFAEDVEITAEANPESATEALLSLWKGLGVNRVSLGVQSFKPRFLSLLDRLHTTEQAADAFRTMREVGIENRSLDLIYGLPGQTLLDWEEDLERALSISPRHISFYNLILHPNLPVTQKALAAHTPDHEEVQAEMFLLAVDRLESQGYEVYELSNAALPGYSCRHNRLYWEGGEWLGLGLSASSRFGGGYFANPSTWSAYVDLWGPRGRRSPPSPRFPSPAERLLDAVMLSLRTREGLSLADLETLLEAPLPDAFRRLRDQLWDEGYVRSAPERISLTPKGWLVHSEITTRVVQALEGSPSRS